jgi:hypothetical protein
VFGQSRPIATFAARIDVAYLAGLLPKNAHRELHLIRRIRNEFGHSPVAANFKTAAIAARCRELKCKLSDDLAPRIALEHSAFFLLGAIDKAQDEIPQIKPRDSIDIESIKSTVIGRLERIGQQPAYDNGASVAPSNSK